MNVINLCILGAGGQLGTKLIERFSKNENFRIYAVDKKFDNKKLFKNLIYISLDVNNSLEKKFYQLPDENIVFINCIGLQHALLSRKIMKINFDLNKKLFEYIDQNYSSFKFIHISSLSVDKGDKKEIILGSGNPINLYGKSKLKFENYLSQNDSQSKKIPVVRPAAFYDLKLSKNLDFFFELLLNKFFILPSTNILRSFLSLEYFSKFLEEYILLDKHHKIFEIADKEPIEFNSLIKFLKKAKVKVNSKIFFLPIFIFKLVGQIGYLLEKVGLHISLFTIIGEFGYDFVSKNNSISDEVEIEDTYENFKILLKGFN